jgi:hypothetical protein
MFPSYGLLNSLKYNMAASIALVLYGYPDRAYT